MRKFKGIELPVNSVIIIALAIFVLLMLAAFFSKSSGEIDKTQIQSAFNSGCSQLSSMYDCTDDAEAWAKIKTSVVQNGNALTLKQVCQAYFNNPLMSEAQCRDACPVCKKTAASEGTPCPNGDDDCKNPYGTLICTSDGYCCSDESDSGPNCIPEYGDCRDADRKCTSPQTCKKGTDEEYTCS
jgi:hypothetical protein